MSSQTRGRSIQSRARFDRLLQRTPLQPLFQWRAERSLVVLAYHRVREASLFAEHLDWIRRERHPITLSDLERATTGGGLPRRAVMLTFDDADRTLVDVALPLLRERSLPAVAFVVADLVDTDRPFWWAEVTRLLAAGARASGLPADPAEAVRALKTLPDEQRRRVIRSLRETGPPVQMAQLRREELTDLESAGVAVGNHTLTHPCLSRCVEDVLRHEIVAAHDALIQTTGHDPTAFAYPDGDRDRRAEPMLRELGYRSAFLFDHRINYLPLRDPLSISRVRIDADASLDRLRIVTSGLHPAVLRLRGLP